MACPREASSNLVHVTTQSRGKDEERYLESVEQGLLQERIAATYELRQALFSSLIWRGTVPGEWRIASHSSCAIYMPNETDDQA